MWIFCMSQKQTTQYYKNNASDVSYWGELVPDIHEPLRYYLLWDLLTKHEKNPRETILQGALYRHSILRLFSEIDILKCACRFTYLKFACDFTKSQHINETSVLLFLWGPLGFFLKCHSSLYSLWTKFCACFLSEQTVTLQNVATVAFAPKFCCKLDKRQPLVYTPEPECCATVKFLPLD